MHHVAKSLLLSASLFGLGLASTTSTNAADGIPVVTSFAGSGSRGFEDGPGKTATFSNPQAVAVDAFGIVYVADTGNNAIRKVDATGNVSTLAGDGSQGFADGKRGASFNAPNALTIDATGNVYVSDGGNRYIRKITPDGTVSTVAGLRKTVKVNGMPATFAFTKIKAIAIDNDNNIYAVDNDALQRIDKDGNITTFPKEALDLPTGIATDNENNLYVIDPFKGVKRIDPAGKVAKVLTFSLDTATSSYLGVEPKQIAADSTGGLVVSNSAHHTIDQIDSNNSLTRVAGTSAAGFTNGLGGTAGSATFRSPGGIAFDTEGNIIVADAGNNSVRKIAGARSFGTPIPPMTLQPSKLVKPETYVRIDSIEYFNQPAGVALDAKGNPYVSDSRNARVRYFSKVVAGGTAAPASDLETSTARFHPTGLAFDNNGGLYIADSGYSKIRKVLQNGQQSIVAGSTKFGFVDGPGGPEGTASFNTPIGVAVDADGNVYVADSENNAIRKIDRLLNVTTLAGTGKAGFDNGPGGRDGTATFNKPSGVAVDRTTGAVFVTDTGNNSVRKIDASGNVSTYAGNGASSQNDGTGGASGTATFNRPRGLAIDKKGFLYVADSENAAIRKIDLAAQVTTAVQWPDISSPKGTVPFALAVADDGTLFVATAVIEYSGTTTAKQGTEGRLMQISLHDPRPVPFPTTTSTAAPPTTSPKPPAGKLLKKARVASKKPIKK